MNRPAYIKDEHLTFLDELRESGETNMYGSRPYLMEHDQSLKSKEAGMIVIYWMKTFGKADR